MAQETAPKDLLERIGRIEDDLRVLRTNPRLQTETPREDLVWHDDFSQDLTGGPEYTNVSNDFTVGGVGIGLPQASNGVAYKTGKFYNTIQSIKVTPQAVNAGFRILMARHRHVSSQPGVRVVWDVGTNNGIGAPSPGTLRLQRTYDGVDYTAATPVTVMPTAFESFNERWLVFAVQGNQLYAAVLNVDPGAISSNIGNVQGSISAVIPKGEEVLWAMDTQLAFGGYNPSAPVGFDDYKIWRV